MNWKNIKKIDLPKIFPFQRKGDFSNLMKHKNGLPEWANYNPKLSAKSHICCTSKHKMRIKYGKCKNEEEHSDKNLQNFNLIKI